MTENKYEVTMTVYGTGVNDVASRLLAASYVCDIDIDDLVVEFSQGQTQLLAEDVNEKLTSITNPVDNVPGETFQFPKIGQLVNGLQKKRLSD